jgi:4'-phosphopantetheinyl transferase
MSTQTLVLRHGKIEQRVCFAAVGALPAEEFLSDGEKLQFAGFKFAAKQEGFLLGRLAAKRALGALLAEPDLRSIEIRAGIYGQPIVDHPRAGSVQVSVSHSHGLAVALAFPAEYPMGIDLETVATRSAGTILGELQASPAELTWLVASGVDEATACYVLWTAREALGKALKIGINSPLGILALGGIQADGEKRWAGRYLNFPQCRCLAQAQGERVLSLALPKDVELDGQLQFLDSGAPRR